MPSWRGLGQPGLGKIPRWGFPDNLFKNVSQVLFLPQSSKKTSRSVRASTNRNVKTEEKNLVFSKYLIILYHIVSGITKLSLCFTG